MEERLIQGGSHGPWCRPAAAYWRRRGPGSTAKALENANCQRVNLHERSDLKEAHVVLGAGLWLHLGAAGAQAAALQSTEERAP